MVNLNVKFNYMFGILIILLVLFCFPNFNIPIQKEYLKEAIGQTIICYIGVGILINELLRSEKSKKTPRRKENLK